MKKARKLTSLVLGGLATVAFASGALASQNIPVAEMGYVSLGNYVPGSRYISPIRLQALRETAIHLGATGALAWRAKHIDAALTKQSTYLSHVFNFQQLLLNHNVLPPVLVEATDLLNLASNDAVRTASKTYKILEQARFVTTAPTWRTYLWMDYKKPTLPNYTLLPKNRAEAAAWNKFIKVGWKEGLQQANDIFSVNLHRLKRDYTGMVLYRKLLAQHIVSAPYVAQADLGVTGNSKQIRINDRVLRITSHSKLQTNSSKWTPVLTK